MRGRILCTAVAVALVTLGSAASADDLTICADRPGKSTASCTVPAGHFQVESGLADWSLQRGGGERDTSLVIGETTLRYGLTDHSDIEVDVTPWQRSESRVAGVHSAASGFGDVTLIYKHELTRGDGALQVSVYPFVKVPTAGRRLGNGKWEGGLLVPVDFSIGSTPFSINITPEIDWAADADGHGHHAAMVQVASLGWQATDRLNVSAELWGQWDWDPAGTTRQASADGSVAYLVSKRLQLDAGANFGLNRATADVELYAGIARLF